MNPADNLLFGAAASRKIDVDAQAHLGITGFALMERAAAAIFSSVVAPFSGCSRADAILLAKAIMPAMLILWLN